MRDALTVAGIAVLALIIGAGVYLYGGAAAHYAPPAASSVSVSFTPLAQGAQSSVTTRANYLITTQAELAQLWRMLGAGAPALPAVDFTQDDVIAVFAGSEPTAGYAISVAKVADAANRLVTVTLSSPDSTCVLAESLTAPYQVVELAKTALPLAHEDTTATTNCLQ